MNIKVLHLINGAILAEGLTVIIDVFRAFSTACYAINNGAGEIIPVGDINRFGFVLRAGPYKKWNNFSETYSN